MTFDEYISEMEARRDALRLRLSLLAESNVPDDDERVIAIANEAQALRHEIEAAIREYHKRPS